MNIYEHYSDDGAITFGSGIFVTVGTRPSLAQAADGTLICSYENAGYGYLRESRDFGDTWSAAFGSQRGYRPFVWTDPKNLILHRTYQSGTSIYHHYSVDGGDTWSAGTAVVTEATSAYPEGTCLKDGRPVISYCKSSTWYTYRCDLLDGSGSWTSI